MPIEYFVPWSVTVRFEISQWLFFTEPPFPVDHAGDTIGVIDPSSGQ